MVPGNGPTPGHPVNGSNGTYMRMAEGESGPTHRRDTGAVRAPCLGVRNLIEPNAGTAAVPGSPACPAIASNESSAISGPPCAAIGLRSVDRRCAVKFGSVVPPPVRGNTVCADYWGIDPSSPST